MALLWMSGRVQLVPSNDRSVGSHRARADAATIRRVTADGGIYLKQEEAEALAAFLADSRTEDVVVTVDGGAVTFARLMPA